MGHSLAVERNGILIIILSAIFVTLVMLLAVAPSMLPFAGIAIVLLFCAQSTQALMSVVLVFVVVSTLPDIAAVADTLKVQLLPTVSTDFMGLVRTLLAALMVVRAVLSAKEHWSLVRRASLCFLLLWGYAIISLAWSPPRALGESLRLAVYLSLAFGIYITTLQVASLKRGNISLLKKVLLLAVIVGVGSLLTFTTLPEISDIGISDLDRGERLIGIAASPNILAANLAIFIALGIAFLVTPGIRGALRRGSILILALSMFLLLFTYSRSGWVGAGLAMVLALVLRRKWWWLLGGTLGMVVLLFGTPVGNRFLGDWQSLLAGADLGSVRGYQNAHGRMDLLWSQAIQELATPGSMAWGQGAGTAQAWAFAHSFGGMHSEFLQIWLDFGFLGLGLLLLGFAIVMRRAFRLFRTASEPIAKALGLGSLCVFAAMLPCFVWQHVFNGPSSWLLLIVWGLTLGAEQWVSGKQAAPVRVSAAPPALRYRERFRVTPIRESGKGTQPA